MLTFTSRIHARDIVCGLRFAVGAMVVAGLGCFQTMFRPEARFVAPHSFTATGSVALLAAFAAAVGLAIYAAAADVDGPQRRNFPRRGRTSIS
jgi:hypothetical protein